MNTMILASDDQYVSIEKPTVLQSNSKQQTANLCIWEPMAVIVTKYHDAC